MGILATPAQFIEELRLPRGFSVCELGDQYVTHTTPHRLARDWYKELGCGRYESIDGNERGTIVRDLNRSFNDVGRFTLVTDFGTGEHVFNQAQVWASMHYICEHLGYIAFDRPIAGYPGHGYYLIDPSLVRDLAYENDYEVVRLEEGDTSRGRLIRGVFRKMKREKFKVPQMGRYKKLLRPIIWTPEEKEAARVKLERKKARRLAEVRR
jgi:hypothetical protein